MYLRKALGVLVLCLFREGRDAEGQEQRENKRDGKQLFHGKNPFLLFGIFIVILSGKEVKRYSVQPVPGSDSRGALARRGRGVWVQVSSS